jgi:Zn-dependent peptidase ImmA (M78 family)/transcriptional regulator with XRE-family HTH domain
MPTQAIDQYTVQIGQRIRVARERNNLTQVQLGERLGIKDRQTVAAIEAGGRKVSADELVSFMKELNRDLDFFTDPFRLVDEGQFSFRARGSSEAGLEEFEETAGKWIAFWREQGRRQKESRSPLQQRLELNAKSSYADAMRAGDQLWDSWNLGDVPAERILDTATRLLNLLILHVDMPAGIHGAACQVPGADTVLVNRKDSEGRRNFDLAHEVFHVLTWEALPPRRVDQDQPNGYNDKHTERLADNFSGALLMPRALLDPLWAGRERAGLPLQDWITATAHQFRISGQALKWRLHNLGWISKAETLEINDAAIADAGAAPPPKFSRAFMERAARALDRGDVSVMRLAKLLSTTGVGELEQLFREHGLPVPFDI